jgi:hypothetical protein
MVEPGKAAPVTREFAGVWTQRGCSWCGQQPVMLGVYIDLNGGRVLIRPACEEHTEVLFSLIDGLTDGRLMQSIHVPSEELN